MLVLRSCFRWTRNGWTARSGHRLKSQPTEWRPQFNSSVSMCILSWLFLCSMRYMMSLIYIEPILYTEHHWCNIFTIIVVTIQQWKFKTSKYLFCFIGIYQKSHKQWNYSNTIRSQIPKIVTVLHGKYYLILYWSSLPSHCITMT